jgi:hypothetical protein
VKTVDELKDERDGDQEHNKGERAAKHISEQSLR